MLRQLQSFRESLCSSTAGAKSLLRLASARSVGEETTQSRASIAVTDVYHGGGVAALGVFAQRELVA